MYEPRASPTFYAPFKLKHVFNLNFKFNFMENSEMIREANCECKLRDCDKRRISQVLFFRCFLCVHRPSSGYSEERTRDYTLLYPIKR
jgi:hypothetical protein